MVSKPAAGVLKLVQPHILELLGYEPIEPAELLAERLGVPAERIVKLDGNENPYGPSPKVLEALGAIDTYNRYPDPQQRRMREALAAYTGVGPEHIVAGHGSDELIDLLLRATVGLDDTVIDCPPTFGMYGFSTRVAGGRIVEAPRNADFTLDLDAVRARAASAKAVFVASPNNPTGNRLSEDELDALMDTGLLVVVDEAYVEFSDSSFAGLVPERENLVVLRTFSKWAGLAGLRAGYAMMPAALTDVLLHMKPPYTPNVAAEAAMLGSLADRDSLMGRVGEIVDERERMAQALGALEWLKVYPSEANFLLVRLAEDLDARDAHEALAREGIFVRHFDTPLLQDCLRISVGLPEHTDRLVEALESFGGRRAS